MQNTTPLLLLVLVMNIPEFEREALCECNGVNSVKIRVFFALPWLKDEAANFSIEYFK